MKYFYFLAILLTFSASFAQEYSDSVLFSEDGKYLLVYEDRYNNNLDFNQITVRKFDSLHVGNSYILKDDTIFTEFPNYAGQYGYYFYVGNKKTYEIIYDTLSLNDFYLKYGFDNNNWIHPVAFQVIVDTLRIILDEPRRSWNYFVLSYDTIDMSKSYEFLVKLTYMDTILYSMKESGNLTYIFNSFRLRDTGLYLDELHRKYFLTAFIEMKKYRNDDVTYELSTIIVGNEILESGMITW